MFVHRVSRRKNDFSTASHNTTSNTLIRPIESGGRETAKDNVVVDGQIESLQINLDELIK